MGDSDDGYEYSEVPMPSDDEDDDLVQDVLAALLEYVNSNRLSTNALFQQFDRERSGWTQRNFRDALRHIGMQLSDPDSHAAFSALAQEIDPQSGQPKASTRIGAKTFYELMHQAKRAAVEHMPRPSSLPNVDRRRRDEVFAAADRAKQGWLELRQVEQALSDLYPNFSHAEITLMAFKTASSHSDRLAQRDFRALIEFVRYFNSKWDDFAVLGRRDTLNFEQFKRGCSDVLPRDISAREAEHEFHETLDVNGDGQIPFEEFCKWAAARAVPGNDYESPVRMFPLARCTFSRSAADAPRAVFRSRATAIAPARSALVVLSCARV